MSKILITSALPYINASSTSAIWRLAAAGRVHARFRRQTGHEVLFFAHRRARTRQSLRARAGIEVRDIALASMRSRRACTALRSVVDFSR